MTIQPDTATETTEAPAIAESKPAAPSGDTFPLTLDGKAVTLTVTPDALIRVSRAFGGLIPAMDRVKAVDVDALGVIVHIVLGRPDGKTMASTVNAVSRSDLTEVTSAAISVVTRLLNGRGTTH